MLASDTCGFEHWPRQQVWCRPCTPERHSLAEAAGGLSRYFLAHAGLTKNNPPRLSRAEREIDHGRIAASCWSTTSPATLPCSPLASSTSSCSSSSEFTALQSAVRACAHTYVGRPRFSRSTHRHASRRRPTTRSRLGCRPLAWPVTPATRSVHPHSLRRGVG